MKKAGGIIALIAGLIGIFTAFITLTVGGIDSVFGGTSADTIIGYGWAGIFLTLLMIVFAVVTIFSNSKFPSIAIIIISLVTFIAAGPLVAIFMLLSLIGGILALFGVSKEKKEKKVEEVV